MILTIIQARMSSTRLPGKILMPIAGKQILQHVIDAAPEPKVVAMPSEDFLLMADEDMGMNIRGSFVFWDGDINDVLGRFYHAWKTYKPEADWILRICADCPMLTLNIVRRFIIGCGGRRWDTLYTNRPLDADGFDLELFSTIALERAHKEAIDPYDREHAPTWIYRHFNVQRVSAFGGVVGSEDLIKVSIDTRQEYEFVKKLMEAAQ